MNVERAVPRYRPEHARATADLWLAAALGLLALLIRLPGAGGDLWLDEIATLLSFVRPPLADIVSSYESPNNHVLYSIISHLSITLFGESSWALRMPAMLFGAASVPVFHYLAGHWLARREALAAALILAVSYHHAYFSQNARGYTGFLLLTMAAALCLVRGFETGRTRFWAGYAVLTAVNVYMLLSGLFAAAATALGALLVFVLPAPPHERWPRARTLALWLAAAAALTLIFYAPLLGPMFSAFTEGDTDVGWRPSLELVRIIIRDAVPGGMPVFLAALVVGAPVMAAGTASLLRRAPFLFFVLGLPPLLEMGGALALGAGTYPRRFLLLMPLLILIAVRGAALLAAAAARAFAHPAAPQRIFWILVTAGALAAAAGLPRLYTTPKQDYTGALAFIEQNRAPGDVIAAAYITTTSMALYAPDARSARTAADLRALLDEGSTVWLVATFLSDMYQREPELSALIDQHFEAQRHFPGLVGDGAVHVWRRVARPGPASLPEPLEPGEPTTAVLRPR
jgi:mannosyltransferase